MTNPFAELAAFDRLCETLGSELDLTDPANVEALMEGESNLKEMAEALMDDIDEAEVLQKGLSAKIEEFTARKKLHENTIGDAKSWLFKIIERLPEDKRGKRTLRLPTATVSYSTGKQSVVITDELALPIAMMNQKDPTPDKAKIKAALDAGEDVPGAALSNGAPNISIRRR